MYVSHFHYPFICKWILRLFACLGYCKTKQNKKPSYANIFKEITKIFFMCGLHSELLLLWICLLRPSHINDILRHNIFYILCMLLHCLWYLIVEQIFGYFMLIIYRDPNTSFSLIKLHTFSEPV